MYLFAGLFYLINFNLIEQACETDPVQNRNGIKSGYRIAMIFRWSNVVAVQNYAFNSLCWYEWDKKISFVEAEEHKGPDLTLGTVVLYPKQSPKGHMPVSSAFRFPEPARPDSFFEIKLTKSFHSSPLIGWSTFYESKP